MPDKTFNALIAGREHDPFRILGAHRDGEAWRLNVFRPYASAVSVETASGWQPLLRKEHTDLFQLRR
jgi:hypothetical protein